MKLQTQQTKTCNLLCHGLPWFKSKCRFEKSMTKNIFGLLKMQIFTYYLKIILTRLCLLHMINSGSLFLLWWVPKFMEIKKIWFFKNFQNLWKSKKNTWTSPDGQDRNQIDYILCSQRWRSSIQSAKTRLGADCGSVHELLIAKFRLKLKKVGEKPLDHSGMT